MSSESFINEMLVNNLMGRIKTQLIKRLSLQLVNEYKDELKENFDENKKLIENLLPEASKKIRNAVAGYVTRLIKNKEEL